MTMTATAVALLVGLAATTPAVAGGSVSADERPVGLLLPIRDQAGNRSMTDAIAKAVREELSLRMRLVERDDLRDALRRLRMRDPGAVLPAEMDSLAAAFGAEWIVGITVHQAGTDARIPQVALAGRGHRVGRRDLAWAGFVARSGLDDRTVFGLGEIHDLERLCVEAARELVRKWPTGTSRSGRSAGSRPFSFRPADLQVGPDTRIAVVPFDAIEGRFDSTSTGVLATDVTLAALHDRGVTTVHPGIVEFVLRERGTLWRGEFDGTVHAALGIRSSPDLVLSGTVEHLQVGRVGAEPNPEVEVGMHAVGEEVGTLVYVGGIDRHGRDRVGPFDTRREYSPGRLLLDSIGRLLDDLLRIPARDERAPRSPSP